MHGQERGLNNPEDSPEQEVSPDSSEIPQMNLERIQGDLRNALKDLKHFKREVDEIERDRKAGRLFPREDADRMATRYKGACLSAADAMSTLSALRWSMLHDQRMATPDELLSVVQHDRGFLQTMDDLNLKDVLKAQHAGETLKRLEFAEAIADRRQGKVHARMDRIRPGEDATTTRYRTTRYLENQMQNPTDPAYATKKARDILETTIANRSRGGSLVGEIL